MIQVLILVGILIVLCIQLGIINIRGITRFFRRNSLADDYYSDDDAYMARSRGRISRRRAKQRRRPRLPDDDDISVTSDDSLITNVSDDDNPKSKTEPFMTPLKNLTSTSANDIPGNIRGSDILQKSEVPWRSAGGSSDPETIQRQIMEELGASRYGGSSQLTSMSM
mgnify:CR=1 FL=1